MTDRIDIPAVPVACSSEGHGACPCCGSLVNRLGADGKINGMCGFCGQALDWGADKIEMLKARIEQKKAERNRICKQLKKLRQKLNQAEREVKK